MLIEEAINKIHCADCLSFLRELPAESVDLVITSPPYNLGSKHHTRDKWHSPYSDDLPEGEYQEQQIRVLQELYRVLKSTGSLLYNHKNRIKDGVMITPYEWLHQTSFVLKQEIVWENGTPNFDPIRFYPATERVYWLAKSPQTKLNNSIKKRDFFKADDWRPVGTSGQHTRAFPESMITDLITVFPDAVFILDPYSGSGTVPLVAKRLHRYYIGIEISEEYCQIARERIFNEENQLGLFK